MPTTEQLSSEYLSTEQLSTEQWVERARDLAPMIEKYRDEAEETRQLPAPLFEALRDAGLFRLWVPAAFGGAEVNVETMLSVTEEVSRHDGSVGWNVMIGANTAMLFGYVSEVAGREIFQAHPDAVIAGTIGNASDSGAVAVPGGYRVSGRWAFASGCAHADWMVCACPIFDGDVARVDEDGVPGTHAFLVPTGEVEILDTWYTAGLRGTGSHHFTCVDVFVPERRHFVSHGVPVQKGPLFTGTITDSWNPNIAAVALGIARDAVESFARLAVEKVPRRTTSVLADQQVTQLTVGRAEALRRAGRAYLLEAVREAWAVASSGRPVPPAMSNFTRLAGATAVRHAIDCVDLLWNAGGGSSIYATNRLERCFRDVHMVSQHAVVGQAGVIAAGKTVLDASLPADPPPIPPRQGTDHPDDPGKEHAHE